MSTSNIQNSLSSICYEQIKDNYYYGLYGDFKIIVDKNTGYFNATKLCKDGNKDFKNWFQNQESKNLIKFCQNSQGWNSSRGFYHNILIKKALKNPILLNFPIWII